MGARGLDLRSQECLASSRIPPCQEAVHVEARRIEFVRGEVDPPPFVVLPKIAKHVRHLQGEPPSVRERRDVPARLELSFTLGGRPLADTDLVGAHVRLEEGWTFQATELTEEFDYEAYRRTNDDRTIELMWRRPGGELVFASVPDASPRVGDLVFSFGPGPESPRAAA